MTVTNEAPGSTESEVDRPHFFKRLHVRLHSNRITGVATKIVVTVIGVAVLCAGLIMMVTPGPGIVGIVVGLGILATEWAWADRWVQAAKRKAQEAADKAREMDPAVRRRRLLLAGGLVLLVAAVVLTYLVVFDWPGYATNGWDWVQDLHSAVPELPGM
jgi:uncharacterized protein (TIGR02611 family)